MSYFVVDVEADGPCPGLYSMVSFGAVRVQEDLKNTPTFYGTLKPISDKWIPQALDVSGFTREETMSFADPKYEMEDFANWIKENSVGRPIFISDNNCLKYSTRVVVTEEFSFLPSYNQRHNTVEIYDIVKNKVDLKIPSYNISKNKVEFKEIYNWYTNTPTDNWVSIRTNTNPNYANYTLDHKFFVKDRNWVQAKDININEVVFQLGVEPNEDQFQLILGSLLGDASLSKLYPKGRVFNCSHSIENYSEFKYKILKNLSKNQIKKFINNKGFSSEDGVIYHLHTKTLRCLESIDKENNYLEIIEKINYIGLAFWIMDDGSLSNGKILRLHTEGHNYENNLKISSILKNKTQLDWHPVKCGRGNYCQTLSISDTKKLCEKIHQYFCESMEYKLIPEYRGLKKYQYNQKINYNIFESIILDIKIVANKENKKYRKKNYCIDVIDNHNFLL